MGASNDAEIIVQTKVGGVAEGIGPAGDRAESEPAADRHRQILRDERVRLDSGVVGTEIFRARLEVAHAIRINAE